MANPLTASQQLATVKKFAAAAGITVREYPGWRDRGMWRSRSKGHQPIALTIHQTAGGLGRRSVESYIRDILVSDPAVPDKCQAAVAPNGDIWMVAAGRANHALYYGPRALSAAKSASFPTTGNANYRGSNTNWNYYTYGIECIGSGILPEVQRRSAIVWAAAMAHAHGWTGQEVHGHGEASYDRGFADPGWNMGQFRKDVMALVKGQPLVSPGAGFPTSKDGFDMADLNDLRKVIREELRSSDLVEGSKDAYWGSSFANNVGHAAANSRSLVNGNVRAQVNAALWDSLIAPDKGKPKTETKHSSVRNNIHLIEGRTARLVASVAGLTAAVEALAKGQGVDPAAIQEAVRKGVADALSDLEAEVKLTIDTDATEGK